MMRAHFPLLLLFLLFSIAEGFLPAHLGLCRILETQSLRSPWSISRRLSSAAAAVYAKKKKGSGGSQKKRSGTGSGGFGGGFGGGQGSMSVDELMRIVNSGEGDLQELLKSLGADVEFVDEGAVSGEVVYGDGEEDDLVSRANMEIEMMRSAERVDLLSGGDAEELAGVLRELGVVLVRGAISQARAAELRDFCLSACERAQDAKDTNAFTDVLAPHNDEGLAARFDLRLPLEGVVRQSVGDLVSSSSLYGQMMEKLVGPQAELKELATFITQPGCRQQVLHSDTLWTKKPALFTTFLALQDITLEMGPTMFLPGTHTKEAHKLFDSALKKDEMLASSRYTHGPFFVGDVAVYDSRLLHCGGRNTADSSAPLRVIFYMSFAPADAPKGSNNVQSLQEGLKGKFTLSSLREYCAN